MNPWTLGLQEGNRPREERVTSSSEMRGKEKREIPVSIFLSREAAEKSGG